MTSGQRQKAHRLAGKILTFIYDAGSRHGDGAPLAVLLDLTLATVLAAQAAAEAGTANATAAAALEQTAGVTGLDAGDAVAAHACCIKPPRSDKTSDYRSCCPHHVDPS